MLGSICFERKQGCWVHVALSGEAAAETELAKDRAQARALRCEACGPTGCPDSIPSA